MIINIRGTNGSGKSTIVFDLMEKYGYTPHVPPEWNAHKWEAVQIHAPFGDVYAIGQYKTQCGGCDGVPTQNEICRLVKKYAKKGHVIFEGVIVSTIFQRYVDLLPKLGTHRILFINTPLKTCISRIKKRRKKRGATGTFKEDQVASKFRGQQRQIQRLEDGYPQLDWSILDYKHATEEVICLLKSK